MRRHWHIRVLRSVLVTGLLCYVAPVASAQAPTTHPTPRQPNWPSSEYHGKIDGNGNPIPCRCLYRGQSHKLGTTVCMNTHKGTVLAACDLVQNNTSWVPTDEPCTLSQMPNSWNFAQHNYPLNKQGLSTN
jgi:hypothetical protein